MFAILNYIYSPGGICTLCIFVAPECCAGFSQTSLRWTTSSQSSPTQSHWQALAVSSSTYTNIYIYIYICILCIDNHQALNRIPVDRLPYFMYNDTCSKSAILYIRYPTSYVQYGMLYVKLLILVLGDKSAFELWNAAVLKPYTHIFRIFRFRFLLEKHPYQKVLMDPVIFSLLGR